MAGMTTILKEMISPNGSNQRVYSGPNHTSLQQELFFQRSKGSVGPATVLEDSVSIVKQTTDAEGATLAAKDVMTITYRRPIGGAQADTDRVVHLARDFVASDEFANMVNKQLPLK